MYIVNIMLFFFLPQVNLGIKIYPIMKRMHFCQHEIELTTCFYGRLTFFHLNEMKPVLYSAGQLFFIYGLY
jgi:hypothetical protein